jgi:hypothetical protein
MPAFVIPTDDDGGEEVVFLESLEDLDPEINGARHAPEFDRHEPLGYVPSQALIEAEWYLYCHHCERRSDCEEDAEHEGRSVEHVFQGRLYFCHPECAETCQAKWERGKADREALKAGLLKKYPGITIGSVSGGDDCNLWCSVEFPGGKGTVTQEVRNNPDRTRILWTADVSAWELFKRPVAA